jgi:hypothetical protein
MEEQHQKERETLDERIFSLEFSERVRKQSLAALEVKCANMEEQHRKERESLTGRIFSLESNEKLLKQRYMYNVMQNLIKCTMHVGHIRAN